jgi:hypothetical protein
MEQTREREVYEKLLGHYNRGSTKQISCECGKIITQNILSKHLESKTHKFLNHYRKRAEDSEKNGSREIIDPKLEPIDNSNTMWTKICG